VFPTPSAKTAIVYKERRIPYAELVERIGVCARSLPLAAGERAVIFAENRAEWAFALYAIWQLEGVVVPIDHATSAPDLSRLFGDCEPAIIFCSELTRAKAAEALALAKISAQIIDLDSLNALPAGEPVLALASPKNMDSLAAILYTTGTTGEPKGVMLSYTNLDASRCAVRTGGFFEPTDTILGLLPLHHILPLQGTILVPLSSGCTIAFATGMQKEEIASVMQAENVTTFIGVPRIYELFHAAIMEKVRASLAGRIFFAVSRVCGSQKLGRFLFTKVHAQLGPKVRFWVCGGAKSNPVVMRDLWALGFRLAEGYGLTETSPIISFNKRSPRFGVGAPAHNLEARIIEEEIAVCGANVMLGYYKKPALTANAIRDGWFYTGDTGFLGRKGALHVTGRKDDLIVLPNGKKIDPETIEREIASMSPMIREIGVLQRNGQLAAVIYPSVDLLALDILDALQTIKKEIIERYNKTSAAYRRIFQISIATETLPRTRMGKMRRFMLQNFFTGKAAQSGQASDQTSNRTLSILCEHLAKKKGMPVGPETRLDFDLALDSLDRFELCSFARNSFNCILGEAEVANAESIADLAILVEKAKRIHPEAQETKAAGEIPKLRTNTRSIMRSLIVCATRFSFRIHSEGLENLPNGPCIVAANHESYLDMPCLIALLPKPFLARCITWVKASPVMERVVRCISRGKNIITVHSQKPLSLILEASESVIESGHNLLIFPEGLRSRTGALAAFRPGFAMIAVKKKIPVVPIAIRGTYAAMPRGRFVPRFGKRIHITITPPILPLEGESDADLALRVHDRIADILARSAGE
jgi:long-chain acyl-CoA synthetase